MATIRSAGITAAATLALFESASIFLVWLFYFTSLMNLPPDSSGKHIYQYLPLTFLVLGIVPPLIAAIGIRTGIGLFHLKDWARKAALLWATIALATCLAIIALRPFETFVFPEHVVTDVEYLRQLLVISILIMLLPISVWWLFYFRMHSVKAQFQQTKSVSSSQNLLN
jgi:hypothetical protein